MKILAIDDSKTIRFMLSDTLTKAGYECMTADDGIDGVEKFNSFQPNVVITDMNMPNMDGMGVIRALRGQGIETTVPILVLTTENSPELKKEAQLAGATGWILKPFDDMGLLSVLRRVTGRA